MTHVRLPPYPVVTDDIRAKVSGALAVKFHCPTGPAPGEQAISALRYVFGRASDWSIQRHPLQVECVLAQPSLLEGLFGRDGVVCKSAGVMVLLEWTSVKTSRRGLSKPVLLTRQELSKCKELVLVLEFAERELLGDVQLTLQALVGEAGRPAADERHLANSPGLRLGALSETWELIFDGAGSLFPIVQVQNAPTDPLWTFYGDWEDATFDEFSAEFVALEANESHPAFKELYGDPSAPYSTSLFKQVVASWLLVFFDRLKETTKDEPIDPTPGGDDLMQWDAIVGGQRTDMLLPGSIARAAREFCSRGEFDVSSAATLLRTAQVWIDRRFANG